MSDNSFELIAQQLQQQQEIMQTLLAENRKLRQELAELREGRGIIIEINGQQIALSIAGLHTEVPAIPSPVPTVAHQEETQATTSATLIDAPTVAMSGLKTEAEGEVGTSTAVPAGATTDKKPSFLEEALIDEFSTAMTSPMATWQGPEKRTKKRLIPVESEEEQKATLRRELMGSYILE